MNGYFLGQPHEVLRIGDFLNEHLRDPKWLSFRAAVAFVKESGVLHLRDSLSAFVQRGKVKISVGVNFGGTSLEGLTRLDELMGHHGEIWVFNNGYGSTFHPKVYLFSNNAEAHLLVGSGNLTQGGLYTNYEAASILELDLNEVVDRERMAQTVRILDIWTDEASGLAKKLDSNLLDRLTMQGYLPPEVYSREAEEAGATTGDGQDDPIFASVAVPAAPAYAAAVAPVSAAPSGLAGPSTFFMTLQYVDLSRGQLTPGAQERSPEIYIPLVARNAAPTFWDWPNGFIADPANAQKLDRFDVPMLIGTSVENVTMTYFPHKHEFRLRSRALQNSGARPGDILRIERTDGSIGYLYHVTIIPQTTSQYRMAQAICVHPVRNSPKEWGYA